MPDNVNLDRIGGTQQSGADVVDTANHAIKVNVVAGGAGGGASTIADGADVNAGTTTDAAVSSDTTGTLSAKLRGLVKIFADVWDSVNHRLNVAVGGNVTAVQATGTNLHVVVDSAPTTAVTGPLTDTQLRATAVPVSSTTLATSAKQDTGNTSLASIDGHVDVALSTRLKPSDTLAGVTTVAAVTAITNALPSGTNVIGHVIVDTTSTTAVTQATGTNLHTVVDSGTITAVTAITNALPAGSNVIGHVIADTGSTTAVTGNVTVVQATGTNLHTVVDSGTITAVTGITNALPSGTNLIGKVGIDQTTPGTTNGVQVNAALPAGTNVIGHVINDTGSTTAVTGNVTVVQGTGTNLHVVVDSAPSTAVTVASLPLPSNAAAETGGNLATIATNSALAATASKQDTGNASLATLLGLLLAQGASSVSATGPMVQGLVSDAPQAYLEGYVQPISLTTEGRIRVSTSPSLVDTDIWGGLTYPLSSENFFTHDQLSFF